MKMKIMNPSRRIALYEIWILKPHLPMLPKSAHTVRNTLRKTSHLIKTVSGGEYCHIGLSNGLRNLVKQNQVTLDHLELQINVDGNRLFKSSGVSMWPILCLVKNMTIKIPFVVGIRGVARFQWLGGPRSKHRIARGLQPRWGFVRDGVAPSS